MNTTCFMVRRRDDVLFSTNEKISLFTPLSGRKEFWKQFSEFLDDIEYPHDKLNIVFMDTSHSLEFESIVKQWIKKSDFRNVRYIKSKVGKPRLADEVRIGKEKSVDLDLNFQIHKAMCKIYNTMRRVIKTELVWIIEDDIIPPKGTLTKLISSMCERTVSVGGVYRHRYQEDYVVAWRYDNSLLKDGCGVMEVKGNGFGCVLLRTNVIRKHVFTPDKAWPDFDRAFYHRLDSDEIAKLDWDIKCEHLSPIFTPEKCTHSYESNVSSENFNDQDYLERYPHSVKDIISGIVSSPYEHFTKIGKQEGKIAIPLDPFDEDYYLSLYPDVKEEVLRGVYRNGLDHYLKYGAREGRFSRKIENYF